MRLYLAQHGVAKSKAEDHERPLTNEGLEESRKVASYVSRLEIAQLNKIYHSGKLRAHQTADVFAEHLMLPGGVEHADGLAPLDDPTVWAERIRSAGEDIMLVGHLPHLAKLTALLLTGNPEFEIVRFRNSGVVHLESDEAGKWSLKWVLVPELLASG